MPSRKVAKESPLEFKPQVVNDKTRGLGWYNKDGIFKLIAKVNVKCIAPIQLMGKGLKGKKFSKQISLS